MRLLVKVRGQDSVIIGYCPNERGAPQAIVILDGHLEAVPLSEIQLQRLPKQLRPKHRRRIRDQTNTAGTEEYVAS